MGYIYKKKRRSGTTMQTQKHHNDLARFLAAREVLPGYPWQDRFTSHEAIRAYLAGDEITCLLCGKPYRNLGVHLSWIHGLSAADYKFQFNIPQNYALLGESTKDIQRKLNATSDARANAARARALRAKYGSIYPEIRRICPLTKDLLLHNLALNPKRK